MSGSRPPAAGQQRPLVIYGAQSLSQLAWYIAANDAGREVVAFTVDPEYLAAAAGAPLPVYASTEIVERFPPADYDMLIPLGWTRMNQPRQQRCEWAKAQGYTLASVLSSRASYWPDTPIGEHCMLFENAILQPFVKVGRNVIIRAAANIGHHSSVGDHCFIASNVVTGGNVTIGDSCFIGLGAVIRDNVKIAPRCLIGAGAVIIKDTEPDGVYVGNPARRLEKSSLELS